MSCIYDTFANMSTAWTNAATVLGAVIGIGLSIFAIWLSKKLSDEGSAVSRAIRDNTVALQKQTEAIHKHTKILRIDNLRNLYELSKGKDTHPYWHFRWRFETYDRLGLQIQLKNGNERVFLGHCDLLVQGFSNTADHMGFEHCEPEFYTGRVTDIKPSDGREFPFADGDLVACFDQNGELMISKGTDPYTMQAKYVFMIVDIGHQEIRHGDPTADTARTYPRIKHFSLIVLKVLSACEIRFRI